MFAANLSPQTVRRARPQVGAITPLTIPSKGVNARDTFAVMGAEFAISLKNVIVEPYGIRTRKGYTEWATGLPSTLPVPTLMSYYPPEAAPAAAAAPFPRDNVLSMVVEPRAADSPPPGKLFAGTNAGRLYDVTAGGTGPWTAEAIVQGVTDYWTWENFQNLAGAFLVAANDGGGYAYYNGTDWAMPIEGVGVGEIEGVDPALFCYVMTHKKRLWFIEKDSSRGWYLPVSQITGLAHEFDFGEQFRHGGHLAALVNWTVDGGEGIDDYLVAISSQGDVVVYRGIDPDDPTQWALHGVWYVGALPVGRRSVLNTGGDVHILSHYGVTPLSLLLSAREQLPSIELRRTSFLIGPMIARLMRDFASFEGWSVRMLPKEELMLIKVPGIAAQYSGQLFALKLLTGAWSVLTELPYAEVITIGAQAFAGAYDGRVLRAFNGPLDNVRLGQVTGEPIQCQVTPAYQSMGTPGVQKVFKLLRPTFITTVPPTLVVQILVDFGLPKPAVVPTLPDFLQSLWNEALWNSGIWSGVQSTIKRWLGCHGVGFIGTAQLDYKCGGDTLLTSIDFWTEAGGVL